jgi:SET domain-containing protein 6
VETSEFANEHANLIESLDEHPNRGLLVLILTMMYEKAAGPKSRWKSYLDVLPQSFNTLMWWSMNELKEFQGSSILERIGKDEADNLFATNLVPVIEKDPTLFGFDATSNMVEAVLQEAHVIASQIMSYGFDVERNDDGAGLGEDGWATDDEDESEEGFKAMIPFADMLNADADRNNVWLSDLMSLDTFV